jgi:hypothetical protein
MYGTEHNFAWAGNSLPGCAKLASPSKPAVLAYSTRRSSQGTRAAVLLCIVCAYMHSVFA